MSGLSHDAVGVRAGPERLRDKPCVQRVPSQLLRLGESSVGRHFKDCVVGVRRGCWVRFVADAGARTVPARSAQSVRRLVPASAGNITTQSLQNPGSWTLCPVSAGSAESRWCASDVRARGTCRSGPRFVGRRAQEIQQVLHCMYLHISSKRRSPRRSRQCCSISATRLPASSSAWRPRVVGKINLARRSTGSGRR